MKIEEFLNNKNIDPRNVLFNAITMMYANNLSIDDIEYIGTKNGRYIINDLEVLNVNCINDFGISNIIDDLVITFKDGTWLDFNRFWNYNKTPIKKDNMEELKSIIL